MGHKKKPPHQILESLERWSARATLLILLGIVIEIVALFISPHDFRERLVSTGANALVAIGLIAEYLVILRTIVATGEANRESDEKVAEATKLAAEANERAAKADLARIELEAKFAPRFLSREQFEILQKLRGKIPALIVTTSSDFESTRFGHEIARALAAAGIDVSIAPQRVGMTWPNIYLVFPGGAVVNFWAEPLFIAFKEAGLSVGADNRSQVTLGDLPADIPVVMVGEKDITYPSIPYGLAVKTEAEPKYIKP